MLFTILGRVKSLLAAAVGCALLMSACAPIDNELHKPGGQIGTMADKWIPAPNKQLEVYRAVVALTVFSSMGASAIRDTNGSAALYFAMQATVDDINNLAGHVYEQRELYPYNLNGGNYWNGKAMVPIANTRLDPPWRPCVSVMACDSNPSGTSYEQFEAEVPAMEAHLFKVAVAAMPQDKIRKALDDIGNRDWLASLFDGSKVVGDILQSLHIAAANLRAEQEVRAAIASASDKTPPKCAKSVERCTVTVVDAVEVLRAYEPVRGSMLATKTYKDVVVPREAYEPLYAMLRSSCAALRSNLPTSRAPASQGGVPAGVIRGDINCGNLAFRPNVYRADYMASPPSQDGDRESR